jgi:hypothetical protein
MVVGDHDTHVTPVGVGLGHEWITRSPRAGRGRYSR